MPSSNIWVHVDSTHFLIAHTMQSVVPYSTEYPCCAFQSIEEANGDLERLLTSCVLKDANLTLPQVQNNPAYR